MCASSKDNCVAILQQYNLQFKDTNILLWKEEIIRHAKDEELMSSSRVSMYFRVCTSVCASVCTSGLLEYVLQE